MNETVLTILFVAGVTILLSLYSLKKKNEEWEGELIKKKYYKDEESLKTTYTLIFKTTTGKRKKITIYDERTYNELKIGTRFEKKKGEYMPTAIYEKIGN